MPFRLFLPREATRLRAALFNEHSEAKGSRYRSPTRIFFSHMSDQLDRLTTALADRYVIERELCSGGMATV